MGIRRRKRYTLGPVEEDILQHLTAGDVLMSFLLSARSTRAFYREAHKRARARYRSKRSVESLIEKGLITGRGDLLHLTQKGSELIQIIASRAAPERAWKGSWWVVMYDIPISMNAFRFELRRILVRAGFRKLQHSVWIHPHACREIDLFLQNNRRMSKHVYYMELPPFTNLKTLDDWKKLSTS